MSVLVIRHGLSQANNRENIGTPAFGHKDAELMGLGRTQAQTIPSILATRFSTALCDIHVATSTLLRTQQTATEAGFVHQRQYALLDEVEDNTIERSELRAMLDAGKLSQVVLRAAQVTIETPPKEGIWFTHGLRIAGLCAVLGVCQDERLIPKFCEIRELPI